MVCPERSHDLLACNRVAWLGASDGHFCSLTDRRKGTVSGCQGRRRAGATGSLTHLVNITVEAPRITLPPCAVRLPKVAAGWPLIKTLVLPMAIVSGGPTQTHMSPTRAAGWPPMSTVRPPGGKIGPPTCG